MSSAGPVIVSALATGGASAAVTVAALRVHIQYLRESITRLQGRVDAIERCQFADRRPWIEQRSERRQAPR